MSSATRTARLTSGEIEAYGVQRIATWPRRPAARSRSLWRSMKAVVAGGLVASAFTSGQVTASQPTHAASASAPSNRNRRQRRLARERRATVRRA